ncbi:MAG TPA: amidophosphoribosyltransferase [Armatimonadota bacterium]|nr:amidophosphoribosyltransferase [Armatimonadota bacterium]HQK91958.1 amidophosphoribosyltransferase [Armatimonadota bacterium]
MDVRDPGAWRHRSDSPHEECGLIGVWTKDGADLARRCFFGLFTLQHRGQESAGIAVTDGDGVACEKGMGLVTQVFTEDRIKSLRGHAGIGHTRYSTTGSTTIQNAQPILGSFRGQPFALAHNGNLVNAVALRAEMEALGCRFVSTSDTELIVRLIELSPETEFEAALRGALTQVRGAYSLVILTPDRLIGLRDPWGIRPLCLGRDANDGYVMASETCALRLLQARLVREIEPGEMVVAGNDGLRAEVCEPYVRDSLCVFEFIYFARPDSRMYGREIYGLRRKMGHMLAEQHPVDADLVIGIPDTGVPAAIGYSEASRIPYSEGLLKNRYIQRTFIQPDPKMRRLGVSMKLAPLHDVLNGKRLVVVDDSIVRGTTTDQQVDLLRQAGAAEVHLRICAPPIRYPCFYGIDMANQSELIAASLSVEQIRQKTGADSLGYLSIANLARALGIPRDKFCMACFDGRYPLEIPQDVRATKFSLEKEAPDAQ